MRKMVLAAAMVAVMMGGLPAPVLAMVGDPFEDARYYVTVDDARVLELVDSGKVSVSDTNPEGYTLLHYAADANRLDLVKALLARGAKADAKSNRGSTPWDMATAPSVKMALKGAMATPPKSHVPSAVSSGTPTSVGAKVVASGKTAAASPAADKNRADCNKKWKADYNLCSDTTCKMTTYRKHAKCLKTGLYW